MILLGMGANIPSKIGTPIETLLHVCRIMPDYNITIIKRSNFFLTSPLEKFGGKQLPERVKEPWFINCVLKVRTRLPHTQLFSKLKLIEKNIGRNHSQSRFNRPCDLDLLSFGDKVGETKVSSGDQISKNYHLLTLPHPRLHERAFVLKPLLEVAPNWRHPEKNISVCEMLENVLEKQIVIPVGKGVS